MLATVRSYVNANIASYHFPIFWKSAVNLQKDTPTQDKKTKYNKPDETQTKQLTEMLKTKLKNNDQIKLTTWNTCIKEAASQTLEETINTH